MLLLICFFLEIAVWLCIFYSLFTLFSLQIGDSVLRSATRSLLEFNTTVSCDRPGTNHRVQSSIAFLCGKTLVSPHRHLMYFFKKKKKCLPLGILAVEVFQEESVSKLRNTNKKNPTKSPSPSRTNK